MLSNIRKGTVSGKTGTVPFCLYMKIKKAGTNPDYIAKVFAIFPF